MRKQNAISDAVDEIKDYYKQWLSASDMTEEELLAFRTCEHFRILLQDFKEGFAVQLAYDVEEMPIGLPFFIGFENSLSEKEQYFENTPLILFYIASKLDNANVENPVNGSYGSDYFKDRVKNVYSKIMNKANDFMLDYFN